MSEIDSYQVSVKLLLINAKKEALFLRAQANGTVGAFDLPGGRIDKNEIDASFEQIIRRETKEEIGDVNYNFTNKLIAAAKHKGSQGPVLILLFLGEYVSGEIVISPEHLGYEWVRLDSLQPENVFKGGMLDAVKTYLANPGN